MDLGLESSVVFLTGASGGIGRAVAETFAEAGARLALQGHRQFEDLERWVAEQSWREQVQLVKADVTQPKALEAAFDRVAEHWGRIDVAIANAGVWPPEELLLDEIDEQRLRAVIDVNLFGAVWTARAFMRALKRSGPRTDGKGACLLFTGSTAGRFGELGHADYAVSKAGLEGLVRTLKNEIVRLDPFARVNMVEPGWTVTSMARPALQKDENIQRVLATLPLDQLARAKDIARTFLYLASPVLARHVTGQTLTVAGGMEGRLLRSPDDVNVDVVRARLASD